MQTSRHLYWTALTERLKMTKHANWRNCTTTRPEAQTTTVDDDGGPASSLSLSTSLITSLEYHN